MRELSARQQKLHKIIFGTERGAGRIFDVCLIYAILISVLIVVLDSVESVKVEYHAALLYLEWFFTLLFTLEYVLRIYCSPARFVYMRSFFGIIDLLSIIPTYLTLVYAGANYLMIIRILRVLRVFRILKLVRYMGEANLLMRSLLLSRRKILVFFSALLAMTTVFGSIMFIIEGPENGFTSIPRGIYWAIITITTVGYGDISPQTPLGQALASIVMILGYSVFAVPTGIITAELAGEIQRDRSKINCPSCDRYGHESDALHCRFCGGAMPDPAAPE